MAVSMIFVWGQGAGKGTCLVKISSSSGFQKIDFLIVNREKVEFQKHLKNEIWVDAPFYFMKSIHLSDQI